MRGLMVAASLVALAAAGCLEGSPTDDVLLLPDPAPAMVVPGDRPVIAETIIREEPRGDPMAIDEVIGAETWEPRDVPLTYHGIQKAHDEWARHVDAHVFRYEPMRLVITDMDLGPAGLKLWGHYEPHTVEYLFDATDGRFLGHVDLDAEARGFRDPATRDALAWMYEAPAFFFMQLHALAAVDEPFASYDRTMRFVPYEGAPPRPGDCAVHRLHWLEAEEEPREGEGAFVCTRDTGLPLWAGWWRGDEGVAFERTGPSFQVPRLVGDPLPPHVFETHTWDEATGPLPGMEPVLVPPVDHEGGWADALRARTEGLFLSSGFLAYQSRHDTLYLNDATTGWPAFSGTTLLELLLGTEDPAGADERSWMWTTDGEGFYWGQVDTWYGGEGDDTHIGRQEGWDVDDSDFTYPDDPPDMVRIGEVATTYADVVPAEPRLLKHTVWPEFDDVDLGAMKIMEWGLGVCFEEKEGRYGLLSGITGQLFTAGNVHSHENGCSAGGASSVQTGPGHVLTLHPVGDRLVLMDPEGPLAVKGPEGILPV